ncbi:MAG TPA: ABC transporter ATP-binding protein [Candidatus Egerieimonas faecigallinarum]|nr:ABC transporter ATP-binding protein [Candidatus Egerieimonas faecigallinarum]
MDNEQAYFEEEIFEAKDAGKTLRRFIRSMGRQRVRLVIVLLSVAAYTVFNILAPMYSASVVDLIWNRIKELREVGQAFSITWEEGGKQIFFLLLIYLAAGGFYTLQNFLMASFAERLSLQLRGEVSEKLHRLPLSFYDRHQAGAVMSHITNDLDKMSEALQTGMIRLFVAVGVVTGSVIMMLRFSVVLTVVFLGFACISLLVTQIVSKRTLRYAARRQQAVGKLNGLIEESYSGRMVIKAFNYEEQSSECVHQAAEELARASEKTDFLINAVNPGIRIVNRCGMVAIAILGGGMLLGGRMSPGVFQAFFQYVNQAGEPITELSYMINSMQSALASVERVYALLDELEMIPEAEHPVKPADITGTVSFSHVRFGYMPEKLLMHDVSFTARPGQKIAVVGSTGAGKTTLVNLLMRFYEVNGGCIQLDGINTADMIRADLRGSFGMVLQDAWLFEGTIAENIAYGRPDASREEIIAAAKAARADFFIRTLPHGYDTVLSNDAENISIGQRQLLTIARVFLCDPAILILDEATSSVDTRTEMEIGKAMKALMRGRTSFVIAHRLSTIVDSDLILVMQNGNIIEQGNHRRLLEADGAYAELYNSQFA